MGIFRNQAQRVMDYFCKETGMVQADYERILKMNVDMLENRIDVVHTTTGKNGKDSADMIINLWLQSHPDFEKIWGVDMDMFVLRRFLYEVHVLWESPQGAFMSNYPYSGDLTPEIKDAACRKCLIAYKEKWGNPK